MKRFFVSVMLAGLIAVPSSGLRAQAPMGGDPNATQGPAPQSPAPQGAPVQSAPARVAPAKPSELNINPGIFGNQSPSASVVQPDQSRGQLGNLASGGPGVAGSLQGNAAAPQATTTVVTNQAAVVGTQAAAPVNRGWMVHRVLQHVLLRSMYDAQMSGQPHLMPMRGFGPMFAPPIFDLELVGVGMVADLAGDKGPIYRVTIRNNSLVPVHHFRVSLIAVLGTLNAGSPVTTADVGPVAAGAIGHIDIQLPVAVMALGPQGQAAVPFDTLVAAIDSFDELPETNELNNVTTLTRVEVALIETTVQSTAPAAAAGVATAAAPAAAAPAAPAPGAAAAPQEQAPAPAPQDKVDLDKLDLNSAAGTSQLFSR